MLTTNERLADAAVSHAVDFQQYSNGVVQRIIRLLNRTDSDLMAQAALAMERLPPESFSVERLDQLLYSVRSLNAQAYQAIERELTGTLREFVAYEAAYQQELFTSAIPAQVRVAVGVAAVNAEQVYAAAMARPFQGVLLREALAGLSEARAKSVRDAIRIGYVENQTTQDIVRRIRGTRAKGYADGLMEAPRRHIEAITRTALSHTAAVTRERFYEANQSLIKAQQWSSTLDGRTSTPCILRDGKQYTNVTHKPIGHSYPWGGGPGAYHWNCRSSAVPITKSWKELGGADVPSFEPSTRASMDGQVAAETTYGEWLKRQSAARQDQVLGATRGALFRKGGLTVERFANDKGRWLTLDELRARDGIPKVAAKIAPKGIDIPALGAAERSQLGRDGSAKLTAMYADAAKAKPAFDAALTDIAGGLNGVANLAKLKGTPRAVQKIMADNAGDPSKIKDLVRATVEVKSVSEAQSALAAIRSRFKVLPSGFRNTLTREASPADGYRDIKMNVRLPNGTVGEVQINVPAMLDAKKANHVLYEDRRSIDATVTREKRDYTPAEKQSVLRLDSAMKAAYDAAWVAAGG